MPPPAAHNHAGAFAGGPAALAHPWRAQWQARASKRPRPLQSSSRDDEMARGAVSPPPPPPEVLEFPTAAALHAQSSGRRASGLDSSKPLAGGVESATSNLSLPPPAVAVRNLVEQAQFSHLCTIMSGMHHRRAGYPFGTVVDFAADGAGFPVFSLSPLAIQARNLCEDPRCSLVVQMPGWAGLANARVTIFGDVHKLPPSMAPDAEALFHAKAAAQRQAAAKGPRASSANGAVDAPKEIRGAATYFRMNRILDIYFVGGFGTVAWVGAAEYLAAAPDAIVVDNPGATLRVLNERFADPLRALLSRGGAGDGGSGDALPPADDAAVISVDALGADVRLRRGGDFSVERVAFDAPVATLAQAEGAVHRVLGTLAGGGRV